MRHAKEKKKSGLPLDSGLKDLDSLEKADAVGVCAAATDDTIWKTIMS